MCKIAFALDKQVKIGLYKIIPISRYKVLIGVFICNTVYCVVIGWIRWLQILKVLYVTLI